MGQRKSKPSNPMGGSQKKLPDIPPDSPLGLMLKSWNDSPRRQNKRKEKMAHYCIEVWGGKSLKNPHIIWPVFGSSEDWVCQQLNLWVNDKEPPNPEESEYAALWVPQGDERVSVFVLKEKKRGRSRPENGAYGWPPPYAPQLPDLPPNPPAAEGQDDPGDSDSDIGSGSSSHAHQTPQAPSTRITRSKAREEKLFLLREVLVPGGGGQAGVPGAGYVSVPLNTGDVREFKKEMGNLLEDPLGAAERLDQFLGPNIYTWDEIQAILGMLFTLEERDMIRRAGMRIWDQQHQAGPAADQKWPNQRPNWDNQNPEHRANMADLRAIIIQGIKESVPKGQNINKAFSEQQKKDETPTDWLERLRRSLQLYSGVDPATPVGQALLKTQFVAKSWMDIRKKLEKMEDWQERGLDELLREAQKVCVRREEEAQKRQTRILVAAVREGQKGAFAAVKSQGGGPRDRLRRTLVQQSERKTVKDTRDVECFYCKKRGHMKRDCRRRIEDNKMFNED